MYQQGDKQQPLTVFENSKQSHRERRASNHFSRKTNLLSFLGPLLGSYQHVQCVDELPPVARSGNVRNKPPKENTENFSIFLSLETFKYL